MGHSGIQDFVTHFVLRTGTVHRSKMRPATMVSCGIPSECCMLCWTVKLSYHVVPVNDGITQQQYARWLFIRHQVWGYAREAGQADRVVLGEEVLVSAGRTQTELLQVSWQGLFVILIIFIALNRSLLWVKYTVQSTKLPVICCITLCKKSRRTNLPSSRK